MSLIRRRFLQLAGAALVAAPALPRTSWSYPTRPIRLIVPVAAGGPVDVITRLIAQKLAELWSGQFYVENVPTGAGNVATGLVAKAPPDGHTAAAVTTGITINPSLYAHVPYDPIKDFAPITMIGASPHVLVVDPALPVQNVQQLIALVRSTPGKYSYASPGTGQSGPTRRRNVPARLRARSRARPVQRRRPGDCVDHCGPDSDRVHVACGGRGQHQERKAACARGHEQPPVRDIPGHPDHGGSGRARSGIRSFWQGLVLPAGTPAAVVERWHGAVAEILGRAEVRERLAAMSLEVVASTPEQFGAHIKSEIAKWRRVITDAKIGKLDG